MSLYFSTVPWLLFLDSNCVLHNQVAECSIPSRLPSVETEQHVTHEPQQNTGDYDLHKFIFTMEKCEIDNKIQLLQEV